MNNFFCIFILFCFGEHLIGQKTVVNISEEFRSFADGRTPEYLWSDASGHYLYYTVESGLLFGHSQIVIQKYSPSFELVYSEKIEPDYKDIQHLGIRFFQGKFLWFFCKSSQKNDKVTYTMMTIGLDGKQEGNKELGKIGYNKHKIDYGLNVQLTYSTDSSTLLLSDAFDTDQKKNKLNMFVSVIPKNHAVPWSRNLTLPYTENQTEILDAAVKKDGTVCWLAKVKGKEGEKGKMKDPDALVLFQMGKNDAKPREQRVDFGKIFIMASRLAIDQQDAIKCVGVFSNVYWGSFSGIYYFHANEGGDIQTSWKKEFDAKEINFFGQTTWNKYNPGDMMLNDFKLRDDGSAVVVLEDTRVVSGSTRAFYTSKDIAIFTISATGNWESVQVIPKYQFSVFRTCVSSLPLITKDKVMLFYNEDKDNLKAPIKNPKPKVAKEGIDLIPVMTTIGTNGKLERVPLISDMDTGTFFMPSKSCSFGKNGIFFITIGISGVARTSFRIGTISIP